MSKAHLIRAGVRKGKRGVEEMKRSEEERRIKHSFPILKIGETSLAGRRYRLRPAGVPGWRRTREDRKLVLKAEERSLGDWCSLETALAGRRYRLRPAGVPGWRRTREDRKLVLKAEERSLGDWCSLETALAGRRYRLRPAGVPGLVRSRRDNEIVL